MPNRYGRDQLIYIGLNMAQVPNLIAHDMPDGVVKQDAFAIGWLQDILDFWYNMVPFSATVEKVTFNATANVDTITLPTDFILDVKNGYFVEGIPDDTKSLRKTFRLTLPQFLKWRLMYQRSTTVNFPYVYTILGTEMNITPTPSINTKGELWYYKLPPILGANDKPSHPNDYACTEYIRIRALEWARIEPPGTAQKFCDRIVGAMRANGLLNEPEDNEVALDPIKFRDGTINPFDWMGTR